MIRQDEDVENLESSTVISLHDEETGEQIESLLRNGPGPVANVGDLVRIKQAEFDPDSDSINTETETERYEVISKQIDHLYVRAGDDKSDEYQPADQMQTHVFLEVSETDDD